jgi:hypothetical protein
VSTSERERERQTEKERGVGRGRGSDSASERVSGSETEMHREHNMTCFSYLRLNLEGMSLLKKLPPVGPGLGWELASLVGVPSYRASELTGGGRRVPYAYVLRPGVPREKLGLACIVGIALGW